MNIIYLDQNQWIYLSRAYHGRPNGAQFKATLDLALKAVEQGVACFPLSATHYIETVSTNNATGRRTRLAATMAKLSQFRTLIDPSVMHDLELLTALRSRFGERVVVPEMSIIGEGSGHAFQASGPPDYSLVQALLGREGWRELERQKLAGETAPPSSWEAAAKIHREIAEKLRQNTLALDKRFRNENFSKSDRHELVNFVEFEQLLERALPVLPHFNVILPPNTDPAWAFSLLEDLPFLHCTQLMLLCIYDNPQIKRKLNNFSDIGALPQAIVACDYVVTEKQWVSVLGQVGLDKRFRTTLLSNVNDLASILAESLSV